MKIAYILLVHRNPTQVARLISRLDAWSPIFIHVDRRVPIGPFQRTLESSNLCGSLRFVKRHRCRWGQFGIVQATLEGINALVASGCDFDYAMLLSGQDYPIRSMNLVAEFLERNPGRQFIESFPLAEPNRWTNHGGPFQAERRYRYWHLYLRSRHLMLPVRRAFPRGFTPHGGSQWWCLTRECIGHINDIYHNKYNFIKFFVHAFIPDEILINTIVSNSPFAESVAQDDLKFAIWDRPNPPYPATLCAEDFGLIAGSHKLFARKFDADRDSKILDLIDRKLLGLDDVRAGGRG